jgi:hypothetical protein
VRCHTEWVDLAGVVTIPGTTIGGITVMVGLILTTTGLWLHHTGLPGDQCQRIRKWPCSRMRPGHWKKS